MRSAVQGRCPAALVADRASCPRSMRIGPTGERYRRPNPTEPRVSAMLNSFTNKGTLPPSMNATAPSPPRTGIRSSAFRTMRPCPPRGKPLSSSGPSSIEGEPANRRIAACVKSLAHRDGIVDGLAVLRARECGAQADPRSENEDRAPRTPQLPVRESLHERLEKAHVRPQRPGRQFGIGADEASGRRLERIVPRVTNQRRRDARQPLRRETGDRSPAELRSSTW